MNKQGQIKQIICMKWGNLYGPEYVNRLYAMARLQINGQLRFVCLTDNRAGIRPEVECHSCPEIKIPPPHSQGGWRKILLFNSLDSIFEFSGDWLFLDLDVVVSGPLDDFFSYKKEKSFIVMQNWTQAGRGIGNTSVYRFRTKIHDYLLTNILNNHEEIIKKYRNEQTYVSKTIKEIEFWPNKWCLLFKVQCVPAWPRRFWTAPVLPESARVVAFPGNPNPPDALAGRWPEKKRYKKIYKFIRPTPWIEKIWQESEENLKKPFS